MPRPGRAPDPHKERFWRQTLQRFERSPLNAADFCRLHDLTLSSFYRWKRVLQQRDLRQDRATPTSKASQLPFFLPLQLAAEPQTTHAPIPATLEVLFPNGLLLRIPKHFDATTLQQLLSLLRGEPC